MSETNKISLQCEIVTPLLMHGVDKNAELREQSFKGVMRFWWRAIHGNLDLEALKKEENKIFGNTEHKSSFRMKINNNNLDDDEFKLLLYENEIEAEIKKKNPKIKNDKLEQQLKKYKKTKSKGFKPNQTFEIEFLGQNLDLVKDVFILSTILGGFGQRSRRGFGSIRVIEIRDKKNKQIDFDYPLNKNEIVEFIKKINHDFTTKDNNENFKSFKKFPYIKNIEIGNRNYSNMNDLLRNIGVATHNYPCFGSANPRFASPLWISAIRTNELFYPIVTELYSPIFCCKKLLNKNKNFQTKDEKVKTHICLKYLQEFKRIIL